jgi:hypothetical protein
MILLPTRGMAGAHRAVTAHHIQLDAFSDWIEACVLLEAIDVSRTDVVDVLLEEELYDSQDFAREIVDAAFLELERRSRLCPAAYGISIDGEWVRGNGRWTDRMAHTFCLILSLAPRYDWWHKHFGANYLEQGRLFELLTDRAITALSPGWSSFSTGWSGAPSLPAVEIAQAVADRINSGPIIKPEWKADRAKDLSLDILFYLPFSDGRQGGPYFLVQCASGSNWNSQKLKEPDIELWRKILNPDMLPVRGMSVPFCLLHDEFKFTTSSCAGLFLDRCRLLGAADKRADWLPHHIAEEMQSWSETRIRELLQRSK